jgi:hypothetical protein
MTHVSSSSYDTCITGLQDSTAYGPQRARLKVSVKEEDTCMSYEEEDTCNPKELA